VSPWRPGAAAVRPVAESAFVGDNDGLSSFLSVLLTPASAGTSGEPTIAKTFLIMS